jgi:MoaA/NifB/PqqE/SkfB family radical SAM enzyme
MDKLENIGFYTLSDERAKNSSLTSQMKRCEMIITEYCNFSCPYCRGLKSYIYGDRKHKQLTLDEIKRNIDYWCEGQPLENIRFSGGEPTIHPDIVEIIKYAKQSGIKRIAVSTNGSNKLELYKELIEAGVNDFSISLDACCAEDGDKMSGGVKGSWEIVINNIREISKLTYVSVGVVLNELNIDKTIDTIKFTDSLGVSDIRIISAAQYNQPIPRLNEVPQNIKDKYPILNYRINNFANGINVRGILETDSHKCGLMLDDSIIAGDYVFNCVIHMREGGQPICKVGPDMRQKRFDFMQTFDTHSDPICKKNCLDICKFYNKKYDFYHGEE